MIEPVSRGSTRETGIARVLTSTSIFSHPTALMRTGLPILQIALDVDVMTNALEPLLAPLAQGPEPPTARYARLVAYKEGNRGIIAYEVDIPGDGTVEVFGKLYPDLAQAARVHDILWSLWGDVFSSAPDLAVPRPLGCVQELSMLIYLPETGDTIDELIQRDDPDALAYVSATGSWLAGLHLARMTLDRAFQIKTELVNLAAWGGLVGHHSPDLMSEADRLTDVLQDSADAAGIRSEGPIHKDFHYRHVLVNEGISVIDLDEVRAGDPNFDLAHFCAHLDLLSCRTPGTDGFAPLRQAFLAAYADVTGWRRDARYDWFYAYTCLKIAKQLCTVRGVRPRPEGDEQHRQAHYMLERGLVGDAFAG